MTKIQLGLCTATTALASALIGCATFVPKFDTPYYENGAPSTATITREIECELYNLVRSDVPPELRYKYREDLLTHNYQVAMLLNLDVTDTGGVAPSFSFPVNSVLVDRIIRLVPDAPCDTSGEKTVPLSVGGPCQKGASVGHQGGLVTIEAKPESIRIDLGKCAVLVIDMQNDFGAKGGMFNRAGIDISPIERAVAPTMRAVAAARSAAMPIVYLKMQHTADLANAGRSSAPHWIKHKPLAVGETVASPDGRPGRVLVEDTWNTEILPSLTPLEGDVIVPKHRYSGFFETNLDGILRDRGIEYLVVTGCTTSVCVESTIRDAMFRDYHCLLLEDCTGEPIANNSPRSNHEASLLTIQLLFGWVSNSEQFVKALTG